VKKFGFPLILVVIAAALAGLFVLGNKDKKAEPAKPRLGTKHEEMPSRNHVADGTAIKYSGNPPTSGDHFAQPEEAGIKEGEIPDGKAVHNLEHGYIWITYRPCNDQIKDNCLSESQIKDLKRAASDLPGDPSFNKQKFILSPRSANPKVITLVAWNYSYDLEAVDANVIKEFYDTNVNQGSELVP
jgi:hypothetical protein